MPRTASIELSTGTAQNPFGSEAPSPSLPSRIPREFRLHCDLDFRGVLHTERIGTCLYLSTIVNASNVCRFYSAWLIA